MFFFRLGYWICGSFGGNAFDDLFSMALIRQDCGLDDFSLTVNNDRLALVMERQQQGHTIDPFRAKKTIGPSGTSTYFPSFINDV